MANDKLEQFTDQFRKLINDKTDTSKILEIGSEMLRELVSQPEWFKSIMSKLVLDDAFLKSQLYCIEPNEIQIYRDYDNLFSIRAYIWEPNVVYPIHDHGSWGIIGAHINEIKERKFVRVDDCSDENYIKVSKISEANLLKGDTTYVLPKDEGIHQMQAVNDEIAVTIHVYGTPVRKGFIRYFNIDNNTFKKIYSPSVGKKIIAIKALGSINESWAESVLNRAIDSSKYEFIENECRNSLMKLEMRKF